MTAARLPADSTGGVCAGTYVMFGPELSPSQLSIERNITTAANTGMSPDVLRRASRLLGRVYLAMILGSAEISGAKRIAHADYVWSTCSSGNASTLGQEVDVGEAVEGEVLNAIEAVPLETLEDGMTWSLGQSIANLIGKYHEAGIAHLASLILGTLHPEAASHSLRWVGRIKDRKTESSRLRLLGRALEAESPVVRDGAALGLALIGDPEMVPVLRRAIARERLVGLRRDMEEVLRELERRFPDNAAAPRRQ